MTVEFLAVGVDADDLQRIVEAPVLLLRLQARADREHHIGLAPEAVAGRRGDREAMAPVDHALAHAAGHDRRVEQLGDPLNVFARALGTATHDDHGMLGAAQQLRGAFDGVLVDRAGIGRCRRADQLDRRAPRPGIHGAFERDRAPAA